MSDNDKNVYIVPKCKCDLGRKCLGTVWICAWCGKELYRLPIGKSILLVEFEENCDSIGE